MINEGKVRKYLPFIGSLVTLGAVLLSIAGRPLEEALPPFPREAEAAEEAGPTELAEESPGPYRPHHRELLGQAPGQAGLIGEAYGEERFRPEVLAFFGSLTGSEELAAVILENALRFNIPPALAFALCWEESQYNPRAVNKSNRNRTIDRGLFQLNNASFSRLTEEELLDPATNAYYGMSHLRWCLDTAGSEVAGLAMYNAGTNRVRSDETPKKTLDYVSRILESRSRIETLFQDEYDRLAAQIPPPDEEIVPIAGPEFEDQGFRLALLSPLGPLAGGAHR